MLAFNVDMMVCNQVPKVITLERNPIPDEVYSISS